MTESKLMDNFTILTGLTYEEALPYLPFCRGAAAELLALLRAGVDMEIEEDRLALAAAGIAAHRYTLTVGEESFRVGDLSFSGGRAEKSAALRRELLDSVGDLLARTNHPFLVACSPAGAPAGQSFANLGSADGLVAAAHIF